MSATRTTDPGMTILPPEGMLGYGIPDIKAGEVYEFNIHHLVAVDDPLELFPIEIVET